jgi:hypothetical protein
VAGAGGREGSGAAAVPGHGKATNPALSGWFPISTYFFCQGEVAMLASHLGDEA